MNDYAETWLRLKKLLATYDAAAALNQWAVCLETAAEMRALSTDLFLWAQAKGAIKPSRKVKEKRRW